MIPHKENLIVNGKSVKWWVYQHGGNFYCDKYLDVCLRNADYYRLKKERA